MAHEIARPATAFSMTRQRRPRERDKDHLGYIHELHCLVCGARPVEAAHLRSPAPRYGKKATGMQEKPHDKWTVPLCAGHHRTDPDSLHNVGEEAFFARHRIDPFLVATALHNSTGDVEAGMQIIREAKS